MTSAMTTTTAMSNKLPLLNPVLIQKEKERLAEVARLTTENAEKKARKKSTKKQALANDDITRRKHGGNENSFAANEIAVKSRDYKMMKVLELLEVAGNDGLTLHEIYTKTGWLIQSISSLLSRMKQRKMLVTQKIILNGETANKTRQSPSGAPCAVLVKPEFLKKRD